MVCTVDIFNTVDMVCTVDIFNTVDMVCTVDMLYGIQTVGGYKVLLDSA